MDIHEYFQKLNASSQGVFNRSMKEKNKLGKLHHQSACIYEFSGCLLDPQESSVLETVSSQLESSNFSLGLGLYRQSFASLRLALEMGLAAIYFSINKMEFIEWREGRKDIKWSTLVDEENGVLSKRFARAFFDDFEDEIGQFRDDAKSTYRKLSEYVHGNWETWSGNETKVEFDSEIFVKYCDLNESVFKILLFSAVCRYAKQFDESTRDSLQFIPEELGHLEKLREFFGRS